MRTALVLALVIVLNGCSGLTIPERDTVTRPFNPSKGSGRLIDARQRAIISVRRDVIGSDGQPLTDDKGERVTDLVVCAEPSPDVLQATASALGGQISDKALVTLLSFSGSTAENAASIGLRTQTIQLLRDAYFRLCEGYLNDGLDSIAYDILQRRIQSQIVALLAVEQLTGVVKAQQVGLNPSAASDAGAQATLIARVLENAEKELLQLQEEQDKNAADLKKLEEENTKLTAARDAAKRESEEKPDDTELKTKLESAENKLVLDTSAVEADRRKQSRLEEQIKRRQQLLKTLEEAFTASVQATVKSSAGGTATFGDAGDGPSWPSNADVANAVRAITLNAINQDYEAQVCFETLRFRNNLGQFRNVVNDAFDSAGLPEGLEGGAFLDYCRSLFGMQADLRSARVGLVEVYGSAIQTVIDKVGNGTSNISANDAAGLILALSEAVPTEPGAVFLKRKLEIGGTEGSQFNGDKRGKPSGKPGRISDATEKPLFWEIQAQDLPAQVKAVVPGNLNVFAELDLGVPRLLLQCEPGEKPDDTGTQCVARCDRKGVQYDKNLDECVLKKPAQSDG